MDKIVQRVSQPVIRCFLAGVFAVLPVAITVAVVMWVAGFISTFIGPRTTLGQWLSGLGLSVAEDSPGLPSYIVGWVVVLGVILALGVVIELGAKRLIQNVIDGILTQVPLLSSVYRTSKQVVQMLHKKDEDALQGMSAVFCMFGSEQGAGVLALLVSPETYRINGRDFKIVIIPTAPVPFGGGLFFVPAERVQPCEMSVDGLLSIYVSMGVTAGEYLPEAPQQAKG